MIGASRGKARHVKDGGWSAGLRQAIDDVQQGGCRQGRGHCHRAPAAYGLHAKLLFSVIRA
jgi:hypothetical protein